MDRKRPCRDGAGEPSLLVVPASLISNWLAEAKKFTPERRIFVAHSSQRLIAELPRARAKNLAGHDVVLTTYSMISRLP